MSPAELRARLLAWYDAYARVLPWRVGPAEGAAGVRADPYRVWLSEVMLQQTTVPHATPYFLKFLERWPTVADLAAERDEAVMAAWAGLGYYARARNLLACARAVTVEHGGVFPDTEAGLLALPGVGAYTAAAVAAIAFDRPTNVVDGNIERVMARLHAVETPLPEAKPQLKRLAGELVTAERPGDWAQALMDLGASVCRPKSPVCDWCVLAEGCAARAGGAPEIYPRRATKPDRPRRYGAVFVFKQKRKLALVQRPPKGLLGGMLGLPTTRWGDHPPTAGEIAKASPVAGTSHYIGEIDHVFTHFSLTLQVWRLQAPGTFHGAVWTPIEDLGGLPSVFLKAARLGLELERLG